MTEGRFLRSVISDPDEAHRMLRVPDFHLGLLTCSLELVCAAIFQVKMLWSSYVQQLLGVPGQVSVRHKISAQEMLTDTDHFLSSSAVVVHLNNDLHAYHGCACLHAVCDMPCPRKFAGPESCEMCPTYLQCLHCSCNEQPLPLPAPCRTTRP